jgi:ATP-dependent 26S proteasome regulatory subunit
MSDPNLDALRAALAASPENVPLLLIYAEACINAFSLDEARQTFERARSVQPSQVEPRLGIARVDLMTGKTSAAAVRTEQLIAEFPEHAPVHLLMSRIHTAENETAAAVEAFRRALAIDPTSSDDALAAELGINDDKKRLKQSPNGLTVEEEIEQEFGEGRDGEIDFFENLPPLNDGFPTGVPLNHEQPKSGFEAVGGMEALKEQIRMKVLYPMENPELFKAYGKAIGGGVLLYGPPGCGKTLIARATAGEIDANFFSIGIHDVLDAFIGESEKRLHQIFEVARQNTPAVLFFDEIDALAADRRDLRQSAGRNLINQFLAELDSGDGANDGILVLGATNAPWHIDPAFRRPGRFDRTVFVPPPDTAARAAIIDVMKSEKPVGEIDVASLAKKTPHFSGADLKAMFDTATEAVLEQAMKKGRIIPLDTKTLSKAAKQLKPSTKSWFESAKNYALYANAGGEYDDVLEHLGLKK